MVRNFNGSVQSPVTGRRWCDRVSQNIKDIRAVGGAPKITEFFKNGLLGFILLQL